MASLTMTPQVLDAKIKSCRQYEKDNLGIKNGPDFAELAAVLMQSKEFEHVALSCSMMAMIPMMTRSEEIADRPPDDLVKEFSSPSKEPLALMFYIGYKLGRAESEAACLERMANNDVAP